MPIGDERLFGPRAFVRDRSLDSGLRASGFDVALVFRLMASSLLVVKWPTVTMLLNMPLLVGTAFNLARWRGLEEPRLELSNARQEIWQK